MRFVQFCVFYSVLLLCSLRFCFWIERHKKSDKYFKLKSLKLPQPNYNFEVQNKNMSRLKTILYAAPVYGMDHWGIGFGTEPFEIQGCRFQNCYFTNDKNFHGQNQTQHFDAVIFPLIKMMSKENIQKILLPNRNQNQRYIAMFEDSPRISDLIHKEISTDFFNWTMTYRRDSDIFNPYGRVVSISDPREFDIYQIGSNLEDIQGSIHTPSGQKSQKLTKKRLEMVQMWTKNRQKRD